MISCVPRLPLELSFLSGFQAPAFFQFLEYTMFPFILRGFAKAAYSLPGKLLLRVTFLRYNWSV